MSKVLKQSAMWALSAITVIFTFVPESVFGLIKLFPTAPDAVNIIIDRAIAFLIVFVVLLALNALYFWCRRKVKIKGRNYTIQVEYGDLFKAKECKIVIDFDECYTTTVGQKPGDIKPNSICGQYLTKHLDLDIEKLIKAAKLQPARGKSKYQNKIRYNSGSIVPNGDDLLMAFARLDENGLGKFFTRDEYLECISTLWSKIDKYYGMKDVCIPILGSGLTRFNDASPTQQELLDIIIESYKMSSHKIKKPYKLRIICRRRDDFSLNEIGETL